MISRVDRWTVALCFILAAVLLVVIGLVPSVPRPDWIDPRVTLPADGAHIVAVYAAEDGMVRHPVVYVASTYEAERVEYWLEDKGDEAAVCFGRPYRWADPVTANGLDDPEIPDLLREYLAGGGK